MIDFESLRKLDAELEPFLRQQRIFAKAIT